jgi:hypothetical protein
MGFKEFGCFSGVCPNQCYEEGWWALLPAGTRFDGSHIIYTNMYSAIPCGILVSELGLGCLVSNI